MLEACGASAAAARYNGTTLRPPYLSRHVYSCASRWLVEAGLCAKMILLPGVTGNLGMEMYSIYVVKMLDLHDCVAL